MTVTSEKKKYIKPALLVGIPAALIALFAALSPIRAAADFLTRYFSRPVKDLLGTVFSVVPFSVMELEYIAAVVFAVWFWVRSVVVAVKAEKHWSALLRRLAIFALIIIYFFTIFLWIFAIDYRSTSFTERSGLSTGSVNKQDLYAVTKYFIENAAKAALNVKRDAEGHWAEDMDGYFEGSTRVYDNLSEDFPFLSMRSRAPKKMYLFSRLSSWMGFTGVYFPFSGESNINIDAPGCLIPDTIAHELAHQRGVYSEQEANFLGIAACISSGDPVFVYSGFLSGAMNLSNALYSADAKAWKELSGLITGPMLTDWLDNSEYWASFEGKVEEVSSKVYDGYLKAQGQQLGIRSYGACVDLLVAYYIDEARASAPDAAGTVK